MSYEYTPLVTQPRVDLCFVDTPWHDGHILAALEAGDSVQHPPMRLDALPLGDLGDLAVDVQHAEDSSQIQRAGGFGHLLGVATLELLTLGIDQPSRIARGVFGESKAGMGSASGGSTGDAIPAP
jgi:hypothetical protein